MNDQEAIFAILPCLPRNSFGFSLFFAKIGFKVRFYDKFLAARAPLNKR